jgi:hypothetical protein
MWLNYVKIFWVQNKKKSIFPFETAMLRKEKKKIDEKIEGDKFSKIVTTNTAR